ncbi:MAG: tRNA (adenosine(37)-N6)-dimethylallyltransferase MiaA [Victivallales bacterium]|nr:tRNA (adenosine(37)-N6)-dimethylallyltransferase MiaA [Victivallales bacterium]
MSAEPHIVILGPTCCWKSETAIRLAQRLGREIVSCDSMQVYRGLEIGTAQPSREELRAVPHHLIACLDIHEPYDVNRFLDRAGRALTEILTRVPAAVIVGGTGLYARALVYGHALLPADPDVAAQIQSVWHEPNGRAILEQRLMEAAGGRDAVPADTLLNPRRLLRACEVLAITGQVPWRIHPRENTPSSEYRQFCLLPDFALLKERIRRRTALMLKQGWLEEARRALDNGLLDTPTARQALGYRDIAEYLNGTSPAKDLPALTELLANRTIQYARRQYTWFRRQHPGAALLNVSSADEALKAILEG